MRRINLSNLAHQVEFSTEGGIEPIVTGASTLQLKAEDMLAALEAVRAAFDEIANAAESSRAMIQAAGQLSDQVCGRLPKFPNKCSAAACLAAKPSYAPMLHVRSSTR